MSNIAAISDLLSTSGVSASKYISGTSSNNNKVFESMLQSAMNLIDETDALTNSAQEEEIKYALGESDSPLELMVAQQKANYAVSYTVAVRNAVLDAYKEIMNMNF